jgi:translation initiation factor IF-2
MELKANPDRAAEAVVVEAKLDKGRGAVATLLIRRGTLKTGDIFVVGEESGKVRALINDQGQQVKTAGPAMPVEVLGSHRCSRGRRNPDGR